MHRTYQRSGSQVGAMMLFDQCLISISVEHVFHWETEVNGPFNLVPMEWTWVFLSSISELESAGPELTWSPLAQNGCPVVSSLLVL